MIQADILKDGKGAVKDFFISYNKADRKWAEWIAWQLETNKYSVIIQAWDFRPGQNFVLEMQKATVKASKTIAVLSQAYLGAMYTQPEWAAAFGQDPKGDARKLIPVRVGECALEGMLKNIIYIDLVNLNEEQAIHELVEGVSPDDRVPVKTKPAFPSQRTVPVKPVQFPGNEKPDAQENKAGGSGIDFSSIRQGQEVMSSCSPIIVAIEAADDKIDEGKLLGTERHMTITLEKDQLESLQKIAGELDSATSLDQIIDAGVEAWSILNQAQDSLEGLLKSVHESRQPQPIAWTGNADLLIRIYKAILLARMDYEGNASGFVSAGYGFHYFNPLFRTDAPKNMQKRNRRPGSAGIQQVANIRADGSADADRAQGSLAELKGALSKEVVLIDAKEVNKPVLNLLELIGSQSNSATRVVIALGKNELTPDYLQAIFTRLPCVSFGGPQLASAQLTHEICRLLPTRLAFQAVPVALSLLRNAVLFSAFNQKDINLFKEAIAWTTWSWLGRPLFATQFGEVIPALCPHLMDLRSIASKDWYFDRHKEIPEEYKAASLINSVGDPAKSFHLYLSGAGGTGKAVFYGTFTRKSTPMGVKHYPFGTK